MFSQYSCEKCFQFTYVFWENPKTVCCWKCGEDGCLATNKAFILDNVLEKIRSGKR